MSVEINRARAILLWSYAYEAAIPWVKAISEDHSRRFL
jgi:hypothetical protein